MDENLASTFVCDEEDFLIKRKNCKTKTFTFVCESCNRHITYNFAGFKQYPHTCESCKKKKLFSEEPIEIKSDLDIPELKNRYKQTQKVLFTCPDCNGLFTKAIRLVDHLPIYCKSCQSKRTNLVKYGTESATQNKDVQKRRFQTTIERYGGVGFGSDELRKKASSTIEKRFGVDNAMKSNDVKEKAINTKISVYGEDFVKNILKNSAFESYGVDNFMKVPEISKKSSETNKQKYGENYLLERIQKSALDKYGVDNFMKVKEISNKSVSTQKEKYGENYVQERVKAYMLDRYGVENAMFVPDLKEKAFNTKIQKYGCVQNFPNVIASHNKFLEKRSQEIDDLDLEWLDSESFRGKYDNGPIYYTFKCNKCGNVFKDDFHSGKPVCRKCNPTMVGTSHQEQRLFDYIKSIYTDEIVFHDRSILGGKELDVYFPKIKVAIEYNGTYWHGYRKDTKQTLSDFKKRVEEKRLLCEKLGIRLINIDEVDYIDRPEVFNLFIMDTICNRQRVYARNCTVENISTQEAKDFCLKYHVNGFRGGNVKIGLRYNGDLIVLAIFGKHSKYENECIRLCYKTGFDVIGGWERIVKHFGKPFLHYVNLKYFRGDNKTGCGYRFYMRGQVLSRQQLQKRNLYKYIDNVDTGVSDFVNCIKSGGIAIFDCGNDIRLYNQ